MNTEPEFPKPTRKSTYRYFFASKHHGGGTSEDARWEPSLSRKVEFSVFDDADFHDIRDNDGRYYGVLREGKKLRKLGTWHQQIAEFPKARRGTPWHGYPIWAVDSVAPPNRASEKVRPSRDVFDKLEEKGLISKQERKRLWRGGHA